MNWDFLEDPLTGLQALAEQSDILGIILGIVVLLTAFFRFNEAPPPPPPASLLPPGPGRWWETAKNWFKGGESGLIRFPPPPRANTTFFNFWIYRLIYSATAVVVFVVIYKVPGLRALILEILEFLGADSALNYEVLGSLGLAFVIAAFAPIPFRGVEQRIRAFFYAHAMIDARLLRECDRLREADFRGEDLFDHGQRLPGEAQNRVWRTLEPEGFDRADLAYNPESPTAQSMWMKSSLLMEHIKHWRAKKKYMGAFNALADRDGITRSVTVIETDYERLKDKAKACFQALRRQRPGEPEPEVCREFRQDCRELLKSIYSVLARASLKTHFSDTERIRCMGEIGFSLNPSEEGPMPDGDDLVALAILLLTVLLLPLMWVFGEFWKPLVISVIVFAAIHSPIIIAHKYPRFAMQRGSYAPALAFPAMAGGIAAGISAVLSYVFMLEGKWGPRWDTFFASDFHKWAAWTALLAALIALRMRVGQYPDVGKLGENERWRAWGDLRDAAIFAISNVAVVFAFFLPAALASGADVRTWSRVVLPPIAAFAIGFFVPTWYRAKMKKKAEGLTVPGPAAAGGQA